MRIARAEFEGEKRYGILLDDDGFLPVSEELFVVSDMVGNYDLIGSLKLQQKAIPPEEYRLLAPCDPSKIIAVGLNYRDHAEELKLNIPDEPLIFLKPPSSVIGNGESIVIPMGSSRVDYEAELAIVIGSVCAKVSTKDIKNKDIKKYILGYTCANDVTERGYQKKDGQWTRAKSFDTFCPVGPWIATDVDPSNLAIELELDGKIKQSSNTSKMIKKPEEIVSFVSGIMTLRPGDLILTGTPSGVGPMKPGSVVAVRIQGIGTLENPVIMEKDVKM